MLRQFRVWNDFTSLSNKSKDIEEVKSLAGTDNNKSILSTQKSRAYNIATPQIAQPNHFFFVIHKHCNYYRWYRRVTQLERMVPTDGSDGTNCDGGWTLAAPWPNCPAFCIRHWKKNPNRSLANGTTLGWWMNLYFGNNQGCFIDW